MADHAYIGPLKVRIVSDEEAEQADWVVCGDAAMPSPFNDDVLTTCALCTRAIRHRPHMPSGLPKICLGCAVAFSNARSVN